MSTIIKPRNQRLKPNGVSNSWASGLPMRVSPCGPPVSGSQLRATSWIDTATPKAGLGFELDVIAACFIGGASAYGGVGRVGGAVVGAMIMGVMNNGMSILGIGIDYQQVIKGLVLLGAVCIDVYNQRR